MPTSSGGLIIRNLSGIEIGLKEFLATTKEGDYFLLFWKDFGEDQKIQRGLSFFKFSSYDASKRSLIGKLCESFGSLRDPIHDEIFLDELEQIQVGTAERATLLIKDLYEEIKNLKNRLARIRGRVEGFLK